MPRRHPLGKPVKSALKRASSFRAKHDVPAAAEGKRQTRRAVVHTLRKVSRARLHPVKHALPVTRS